jgi:nucleoid-associated protein YgaU
MAVTTNKSVLFLIGGVAAAALVAYAAGVLGPAKQPPGQIAALPQPEPEAVPADQKDARLPSAETPAEAPPAPATPEAAAPATEPPAQAGPADVVPPSFDVVRLEGDGSIVIAGKATAGATVDLLVGSNVIGSAVAGEEGDFAVVLDDPLKPGDYQIVLRATAPDKVVAMSVETAVVSVPATPDGQVLALVEEPGKPSQMIVLPKPEKPAEAAKPEPEAPAPETPAAAETPAPAETKPAEQMQAALPEQPQAEPAVPAPAEPAPAQPSAPSGPTVRVQAVEIDGSKIFVAGIADPGRTVRGYANEILLGDAKASPDGQFLIEADRALAVGDYIIRVDALEPDGVKVAARAAVPFEREPGETIAAVAPEPEPVTPAPPPAVEAPAPTAPAAAPEPAAQPPAAAEAPTPDAPAVPASEPPAPVADAPAAAEAPATEAPAATPEPATEPQAPAAVAQTPAAAEPEPAAPAAEPATPAPSVPEPSQQASVEEPAATEPQAAEPKAAEPAAEQPAAPAAEATAPAADAEPSTAAPPAAEASAPDEPAAETPPPAVVEAQPDQPVATEPPASAATEPSPPTDTAPAVEPAPDVASAPELPAPPTASGVDEVLAPKLQSVDSAVIIRRGDTLWRISYRVYGGGVRYSTIYLANQTQIEDPDRIWPGQVFKVPDKSNDGKADADYSRLGNRLTTVPKEQPQ